MKSLPKSTHYHRLRMLAIVCLALNVAACDDDAVDPNIDPPVEPFSLEITLVDPSGAPVVGVDARLHVPLIGVPEQRPADASAKKARTVIEFVAEQPCQARFEVFDQRGLALRTLFDGLLEAGVHRLVFDGRNNFGQPILGTQVLSLRAVALDPETAEVLYESTVYPVIATSADLSQAPVIGTTDAKGQLSTTNEALFPTVLELPELVRTDENGTPLGTFGVSNRVEVHFREEATGATQSVTLEVGEGANRFSVTWDPTPAARRSPATVDGGRGMEAQLDGRKRQTDRLGQHVPLPDLAWRLHPNFPNPFN